jgi:hypothetical protein
MEVFFDEDASVDIIQKKLEEEQFVLVSPNFPYVFGDEDANVVKHFHQINPNELLKLESEEMQSLQSSRSAFFIAFRFYFCVSIHSFVVLVLFFLRSIGSP